MAHLPSDVYLTTSFMHSGDVSPTTPKLQLQLSIPHHDPTYYIPDGNTVLLVENILFRVRLLRIELCPPDAVAITLRSIGRH